MNDAKKWLVLGADDGLAPAAVRYLLEKHQQVISVKSYAGLTNLSNIIGDYNEHSHVDYIINNLNYRLLNDNAKNVASAVKTTTTILKGLVPILTKNPGGLIINLPPQLCLSTLTDPTSEAYLLKQMNLFLTCLKLELDKLDCAVRFIEPGERFLQF